jgi:hypothetical protein
VKYNKYNTNKAIKITLAIIIERSKENIKICSGVSAFFIFDNTVKNQSLGTISWIYLGETHFSNK